ncbi:MAG TPA: sensor histidine kinase [Paludibacter sp.]|nr:sensor histidine kinase [Paludibacter sp.]
MKKHNGWFWISPLLFATVVMTGIRLVSDTPTGYKFWERPVMFNLIEFGFAIVLSYIMQAIMYYFLKRSNNRTGKLTMKALFLEYLGLLLVAVVILNPSLVIIHYFTNDPPGIDDFVIASIIFSLVLIIVYSIYRGNQILEAYVEQKLQTQKIRNVQIETELKFLKAQFHPHFLFNALNTIYFQIDETNETPRKTIEQLSDLLRYQLYDINQSVGVRQELDFILTYIDLQKVRMKETLRLDIAFDPLLKEQKIHSLLLFPLIENAFKYVGGDYWIKIEARSDDSKLHFNVTNAIPQTPVSSSKSGGIGLENLRRRLEILYPDKYQFAATKTSDIYNANLIIEL